MDYSMIALFVFISACAQWVYWDAKKNKIGKVPGKSGFLNMSAGGIGGATFLLWIVTFPLYLIQRKSLLEQAKEQPQEPAGKVVFGICSAIFAVIAVSQIWSATLPACDSPDALRLANQLVAKAPLLKIFGATGEIQNAAEQGYEDSTRICRGFLDTSMGGQMPVNYAVSWHDKAKRMIYVEFLN